MTVVSPSQAPFIMLILFAPLLSAVLLLLVGKRLGQMAGTIASSAIALSFAGGVLTFFDIVALEGGGEAHGENARAIFMHLFDWISVGNLQVSADLLVDQLSIVMILVVTGVGTLIHIYSIGYMAEDERFPRYFAYLNLFAASMLLLVMADNLLLLYVGWEGVGLCSYLLIGFWFEKASASNAAKKAFLVNRVGDFAFLIGIFLLAGTVIGMGAERGTLSAITINSAAVNMTAGIATIAALLLFAGATAKSAQIPLYIWLPDAMEGPTPVSALIHAATMVTAGVYMVARFSPVFEASGGTALAVVGWIGALTALFAAVMAAAEYDIKRVLAYSTISQLGYMFLAHGVGAYSAGVFHLATHAFFKALMFLGAGAVMHALAGETDMRRMGGLRALMPITGWTFMAGWLAICGVIPFAGFFSKDAILATAWNEGEYALWGIGLFTALLTAFYMSRLYFSVFEGSFRTPAGTHVHVHDAPPTMASALVVLAGLSIVGGAMNLPGFLTLEHFLEPVVGHSEVPHGLTPWVLAGGALLVATLGILLARRMYLRPGGEAKRRRFQARAPWLVEGARRKFGVDELYGRTVVQPGKALANYSAFRVDARWIDGVVNGVGAFVVGASESLRRLQTGYVRNYAVAFLFGVVVVLSVLVARLAAP